MKTVTRDSISLQGAGVVTIVQQKKGHRFTLDSILLADFCRIKPRDRILEPGTGTGIISLLLAKKYPHVRITAIEIQTALADLCRQNIIDNGLENHIILLERDITDLRGELKTSTFDVIVANAPYTKSGAGRQSPHSERLLSRHDRGTDIATWLDLRMFLKDRGRYFLVFPADRLSELISSLRMHRLEPKRIRLVHPYYGKPASLVLIEAVRSAGIGLEVLPPLVVHDAGSGYTEEMRHIYGLQ
ncbi:MAG TPA: methyltransferase [Nitrospirota bacterium]|nr:methyltransferase [Nitrospirota bacterium]